MPQSSTGPHTYEYPRPSVTVDVAVVTTEDEPRVLLIRRKNEPFAGVWALPGGFVNENEAPMDAARRELLEETGVVTSDLVELGTYGEPGRDPRGWTISIAWFAPVNFADCDPIAADDAAEIEWFSLFDMPELAFDHDKIVARLIELMMMPDEEPADDDDDEEDDR